MDPNVDSLIAIMRGYQRGHEQLEALRIKEIRESDTARAIQSLNLAFKFAMKQAEIRRPVGLTRAQMALFGSGE